MHPAAPYEFLYSSESPTVKASLQIMWPPLQAQRCDSPYLAASSGTGWHNSIGKEDGCGLPARVILLEP